MKLIFPDNLQSVVDEAFWSQNPVAACYAAKADIKDWPAESHLRLAIAKAILSSVGYTEREHPFVLPTPPPGMEWHRTDLGCWLVPARSFMATRRLGTTNQH